MHLISITFDDGFEQSGAKIARIHEELGLSASFAVIAEAALRPHQTAKPDPYHDAPRGDFAFWNDLVARGHEVMPHGLRHADKSILPLAESQDLILRCLEIFKNHLAGFDPASAVFHFPYNRATPELEAWLPGVVRAFRVDGEPILNPLPHAGQSRLNTCAFGPECCDTHFNEWVDRLLAGPDGWLVYCAHGVDGEGWGTMTSANLQRTLARLVQTPDVLVLPPARALERFTSSNRS